MVSVLILLFLLFWKLRQIKLESLTQCFRGEDLNMTSLTPNLYSSSLCYDTFLENWILHKEVRCVAGSSGVTLSALGFISKWWSPAKATRVALFQLHSSSFRKRSSLSHEGRQGPCWSFLIHASSSLRLSLRTGLGWRWRRLGAVWHVTLRLDRGVSFGMLDMWH